MFTSNWKLHELTPVLCIPEKSNARNKTQAPTIHFSCVFSKISLGKILALRLRNGYYDFMLKKSLIDTNPYLRDSEQFRKALIISVSSSTAIETGAPVESVARMLEEHANIEQLTMTRGSAR